MPRQRYGRMGRWSKKLIERCLIITTVLFKVKEHAITYEETNLDFYYVDTKSLTNSLLTFMKTFKEL